MKEKNLQSILGKYLKENPQNKNVVYELKMCKNKRMPFKQVADHQIENLQQAKNGNLYHKIADQTFGRAGQFGHTLKKPWDCMNIYKAEAYIVICYYKPRQKKEFLLIDVDDFVKEMDRSNMKSLKEDRAREIAINILTI